MPNNIDTLKKAQQSAAEHYGYVLTQTSDQNQQATAKANMLAANDALQRAMLQQQQAPAAPAGPTNAATTPNPAPQVNKARGGAVRKPFRW
jgi:hypothetical protein